MLGWSSRLIVDDIEGKCAPCGAKPEKTVSVAVLCQLEECKYADWCGIAYMRATEPVDVSNPIINPCLGAGTILVNSTRDMACAVGYPNESISDDMM